jgi:hypothetical protein
VRGTEFPTDHFDLYMDSLPKSETEIALMPKGVLYRGEKKILFLRKSVRRTFYRI